MDLLEVLRMSLLNFKFVMIHIIHETLVLTKDHLNYLKDNIFECSFKKYNRLLFFKKILIFFIIYNNGKLSVEEENIIKDIRNFFFTKKGHNYTKVKDIRNLFRQEKGTKAIKDRMLRDMKNLFEHEKKINYYKPVTVSNF